MKRGLSGQGAVTVAADRARVWSALLDPAVLQVLTPGADLIERCGTDGYRARVSFGVGALRGGYAIDLVLSDMDAPGSLAIAGVCRGALGGGDAVARVDLTEVDGRTRVTWRFDGTVTGPIALAGGPLLRVTSRLFVNRFFARLARHLDGG